jgi:membrane associated rhomboid family serine protease
MKMVRPEGDGDLPLLDVCVRCQMLWFDPTEYDVLPKVQPAEPEPELPPAAKQALAIMQIELERERNEPSVEAGEWPDEYWVVLPAIFGFPVEQGQEPLTRVPWLTWGLSAAVATISLWALFSGLDPLVARFGFIPAEPSRLAGLTFLTSFFLHGGILHLVSNLYFLLIFGDNVEEFLGKERFLILLFGAALVGDLAHLLGDAQSILPCIGASGGISGVIAFYALKFPHVRLGFLVYFQWLNMPARFAFGLWLLLQVLGTWQQLAGFNTVSALAHLGGAGVGVACWLLYRDT